MFEQSVVEARALTAQPWTLAVSVMGQAVLVTAAIVLPMLHPETLRRVAFLVPVTGPPPAYRPPAPQRVDPVRQVAASRSPNAFTFVEPTWVPHGVTILQDPPPEFSGPVGSSSQIGVPGGIGATGEGAGPVPVIAAPPVPKPQPQTQHQVVRDTPKPAPPAQVRRGGEVQASLLIHKPEPVYPPLAKQARISGTVHLSAVIGTDGKIAGLRALDGHPLLVGAAMDAVKHWIYSPTLLNGTPVEVLTEVTVTFTLN